MNFKVTDNKTKKYSAPALTKGLRILELLGGCDAALSTHEIASKLGYTRNEIFRFIAVLEIEEYITKDSTGGGYVLSGKLLELGLKFPKVRDVFELVSPLASELTSASGAPCHIAFPSKNEIFVVRRWEPQDRLSVCVPVGTRRAMEVTASGISMLCSMNENTLITVMHEIEQRNPIFNMDQLTRLQNDFKSRGYVKFDSRLIEGVVDLSIPLLSSDGQLLGALTVPYANNVTCDSTIEEIGEMLVRIREYASKYLIRI